MQLATQQVQAAQSHGLVYIWRVEYLNGKSYEQFDKDGNERSLAEDADLVCKSGDDPYFNTPAFTGVKRAAWIPVVDGLSEYYADLQVGQDLVIFRRIYCGLTQATCGGEGEGEGYSYKVYVLGSRAMRPEGPIEKSTYICPPIPDILVKSTGETIVFAGTSATSTNPNFVNPYEAMVKEYGSSLGCNSGLFRLRGH